MNIASATRVSLLAITLTVSSAVLSAQSGPPSGNPGVPGLKEQIATLQSQNQALHTDVAALQNQVAAKEAQIAAQDAELAAKEAQIVALIAQVGASQNQARIAKTGQTVSYAPGDDGALKKGVALSTPRFIHNGNGTLTDNVTGLIWLLNANCPGGRKSWSDSIAFVAGINAGANDCGDTSNGGTHQTDWRLPNLLELYSLVHFGFTQPALSNAAGTGVADASDPFLNFQLDFYWSSTAITFQGGPALLMNFNLGLSDIPDRSGGSAHYVLAVRGGS